MLKYRTITRKKTETKEREKHMNNMQLFPFERNRYYLGKMLTSADFEAEQLYMNNKRRFINTMMFGSGIICGLSVFNLDDLSVLIESGVAIDGLGREIVIENSVVCKLSALKGFEKATEERVSLCVRYKEEEVHPVYSVYRQEQGQEYENNRIQEGYELFLVNASEMQEEIQMETEFLIRERLFSNPDYEIYLEVPATVCKNHTVKISMVVIKHSSEEKYLEIEGILQLPSFMKGLQGTEISIEKRNILLKEGEEQVFDYWVQVMDYEEEETSIIEKPDTFRILLGGEEQSCETGVQLKLKLTDREPQMLILNELSQISLEMREMCQKKDYVRIADFAMVHTGTAYIIDYICKEEKNKYISVPSNIPKAEEYITWFQKKDMEMSPRGTDNLAPAHVEHQRRKARMVQGSIELPLNPNMKKGEVCYSGEIVHGLGRGNVYVDLGIEFLEEKNGQTERMKTTVYGDISLFEKQNPAVDDIRTAVKVFQEKGTFQAAVKLMGEQKSVVLMLNWFAIKLPEGNAQREQQRGQSIIAKTPTAVIGTREKYYFGVRFVNMEPCSLLYELTEEGAGEIGQDGMYTAPGREGVYEVRISAPDYPGLTAYAYAVVRRKKEEEQGDL